MIYFYLAKLNNLFLNEKKNIPKINYLSFRTPHSWRLSLEKNYNPVIL